MTKDEKLKRLNDYLGTIEVYGGVQMPFNVGQDVQMRQEYLGNGLCKLKEEFGERELDLKLEVLAEVAAILKNNAKSIHTWDAKLKTKK